MFNYEIIGGVERKMKNAETVETSEREKTVKDAKKKRSKDEKLRRGWLNSSKTIKKPEKGGRFEG
jgi:hypothetical protein